VSEHDEQCSYIRWARLAYPKKLIFAIPNGSKRTPRQGKWMVDEGLVKGVPDIMVASVNGTYAGLFIEMKYGKNKPSPEQLKVKETLEKEGYKLEICYSWEDAKAMTESYLKA
jgi:VRR-NUC domain